MSEELDLVEILLGDGAFGRMLRAAAHVGAPEWAIGAGVIRDLVWDQLFGTEPRTPHRDVDVAFFEPDDLSPGRDAEVTRALKLRLPGVPWEAKNQAAVHLWYEDRFGTPSEPLLSIADAVGTWPETAVCVAVRLDATGALEVIAPFGVSDLLGGVWRRNPRRVSKEFSRQRMIDKGVLARWPHVRVVD